MAAVAMPRRAAESPAALPRPELARLVAFVPLALFGGLHWAALLDPPRSGAMILALLFAVAGALVLVAVPPEAPAWRRHLIGGAVTFVLLIVALLCAGVPLRMFGWHHWDDLVSGMAGGISTTPAITVPYRGVDEWARIAIVAGGTGLICLSALLAFWPSAPRPGQEATAARAAIPGARHGHHLAAAIALGVLYAVPIIQHGPSRPWLGGAVFCVFMAAFLWLERLRSDQIGLAGTGVVLAAIVGALVAPHLNGSRPWFDYISFAEKLQPKGAENFTWDHTYGPLDWPRVGREMLRIKAKTQSYWKATNLDEFDGVRWLTSDSSRNEPAERVNPRWLQRIQVVDRGLRSTLFVGAGDTEQIFGGSSKPALPLSGGTFVTAQAPLKPGDSYAALVYTPRPSDAQLRSTRTNYPDYIDDYLQVNLPVLGAAQKLQNPLDQSAIGADATLQFARFHSKAPGVSGVVWRSGLAVNPASGRTVIADSPYQRLYALAQTMARQAATPYAFAQTVRDRVENGAAYDENPPPSNYPLATFLFKDRRGYCQQFSGVMALMLRMGGVPARVASGFSPGSYDSDNKEYVVRDTDAHSWVEAYFPPYGWITFDPTPPASPAVAQLDDVASGSAAAGRAPNLPTLGQAGDRPFAGAGSAGNLAAANQGTDWKLWALGGLLAAAALVGVFLLWRRWRMPFAPLGPELAELQRALYRSGRHPRPDVTLTRLESWLGGSDAAAAYVRAVRNQRYGGDDRGPTAAERRALRRQLYVGLGTAGRLRALWALPPRLPRPPVGRRHRSYTAG
jgi:transglutaminase-like putative cysteine protease